MRTGPLLIMAGGTGGHVYPALAVADFLRDKGVTVLWLGTRSGLEYKLVPARGYRLLTVDFRGIRGKALDKWLVAPFILIRAVLQAVVIFFRIRPAAALGMGGYASAPGGLAAWLLRVPLLIHEQNSVAGATNRLLKPLAQVIMEGFPGTFKRGPCVYDTGNPVRAEISAAPDPVERLGTYPGRAFRLLILGGSQGARTLNEMVPPALELMDRDIDMEIWHQAGERHYAAVKKQYEALQRNVNLRLEAFIEDMAGAYAWADLVLCRAGALTIAELCSTGVASILVPYPHAVDDHQTGNAKFLSDKGCALLIAESELDSRKLAQVIMGIASHPDRLLEMSRLTRLQARPDATRDVAKLCLEAIHA